MKKVKNVSDEQILFDCLVLAWDDTQKWGGPFSYQCFATSSTKMILVETQACLCKFCIPLLACVTESKPANIHGLLTLKKLMHPFTHPVVVLVVLQILLKRRWKWALKFSFDFRSFLSGLGGWRDSQQLLIFCPEGLCSPSWAGEIYTSLSACLHILSIPGSHTKQGPHLRACTSATILRVSWPPNHLPLSQFLRLWSQHYLHHSHLVGC